MFTQLGSFTKAAIYYGLAFALILLLALLGQGLGGGNYGHCHVYAADGGVADAVGCHP